MARLLFLTSNLQLPQTVYIWRWRAGLPKPVGKRMAACDDQSRPKRARPQAEVPDFISSFPLMLLTCERSLLFPLAFSRSVSLRLRLRKNFILNRLAGIIHWVSTDSAPCRKLLKLKDRRSAEFVGFYSSSCVVDYTAVIFSAHLRLSPWNVRFSVVLVSSGEVLLGCSQMSVDILGTSCDQCRSTVQ